MSGWLMVLGACYVAALVYATLDARRRVKSADDYVMAGSKIGAIFGFLTFSATLFSTFTLLGMPDFYRTHGIGAWIFLAVADAAMAFVLIWFALHLRRRARAEGFQGMAGLLVKCYRNRWAGYIYLLGVFIFLVPYVAVQIRGIGIFMNAAFPDTLPVWAWALAIVTAMLVYSEIGGLKAIIYADSLQGCVLFMVTGVIAYGCIANFGSVANLFAEVRESNAALLSVPGPQGLFSLQFLFASFLVILAVPITQPQLSTRIVILRDLATANQMAIGVGFFAVLLSLMIIPIGMYGAIQYPKAPTTEFLAQTIIYDQAPIVAAAAAIGLIAAAMSTADSQIFALGTELRSLLNGNEQRKLRITKLAIVFFAGAGLLVAVTSNDQLVLLARVSFAGTAILAPMILSAVLGAQRPAMPIVIATAIGLLVFLASTVGVLPERVAGLRVDLWILGGLSLVAALGAMLRREPPLRPAA